MPVHATPGNARALTMRFLFTTLQDPECVFYGRVGTELQRRGHEVSHVTYSRKGTADLVRQGLTARCLLDLIPRLTESEVLAEARRIEGEYAIASIRDVYRTDPPCRGRSEGWCIRRTVEHFLALEKAFDTSAPDVLVPEVGNELIRTVAHVIALERGVRTFFLFYTLFPHPLRLCVDDMRAPIVDSGGIRALTPPEREELEAFRSAYASRNQPIRAYRRAGVGPARLRRLVSWSLARLGPDRDNEYLRPLRWGLDNLAAWCRRLAAYPLYRKIRPGRPFVYFPLHDTHDYKIKRLIPHCSDQGSIVEQLAEALPAGYDLVVKEHPMSLGRNPVGFLRRLRRPQNVRLVRPRTSTHDLIREASGIAVISSTVGLEALLYHKPVLTLGQPFYAGAGVTLDLGSFAEIVAGVPALLRFRPDPELIDRFVAAAMRACRPGKPVLVDGSDENAVTLAGTLHEAATQLAGGRADAHLASAR